MAKNPLPAGQVIEFPGHYSCGVAISNHCLLSVDNEMVALRYKDPFAWNCQKQRTLDSTEFLCRFCLLFLPQKIFEKKHYGFLSLRRKAKELSVLLDKMPQSTPPGRAQPITL